VKCAEVLFSGHAVRKMFERGLSRDEVLAVVADGEVIAEYPDDQPYPSVLLLDRVGGRPVHAVVARDPVRHLCTVVTAYVPDSALWSPDFKTRRR
jgi:hypothetical protein